MDTNFPIEVPVVLPNLIYQLFLYYFTLYAQYLKKKN